MDSITFKIPAGHEVDKFDAKSGVITFKEKTKNVMERIKTIDDVILDHVVNVGDFHDSTSELEADEKAYLILKLLAKSLNEGWIPDWNDSNQYKYYPWFEMGGSSGFRYYDYVSRFSYSDVGSRLCFKSRELAIYAGEKFTDVYKRFMLI